MNDDTTTPKTGGKQADTRDEILTSLAYPEYLDIIDTLDAVADDLRSLAKATKRLREARKLLIRSFWDQNAMTVREASIVFGVPKSTLQDWAKQGGWESARGA